MVADDYIIGGVIYICLCIFFIIIFFFLRLLGEFSVINNTAFGPLSQIIFYLTQN